MFINTKQWNTWCNLLLRNALSAQGIIKENKAVAIFYSLRKLTLGEEKREVGERESESRRVGESESRRDRIVGSVQLQKKTGT